MSTKPIDMALDFLPETKSTGILETLRGAIAAVADGHAAARQYDRLVNRGVPHDKAIELVHDTHFVGR